MADATNAAGTEQVNTVAEQQQQQQAQQPAAEPVKQPDVARPASIPTFDEMLRANGYQAEFDRRVQKAIATAQGKFSDPQVAELKQQLDGYIRREATMRAGIAPEFVDFVAYEVGRTLPEGGKFEDGLKSYLEAHAQFKAAGASAPAAWSQPMQQQDGGAQADDGVTAAFKKLNPGLKL